MTTETRWETDELADLVDKKHRCLLRLRELGQEQLRLVGQGAMTSLLELLAYKQKIISAIRKIERSLDPFRDQAPEERTWRDEETRRECARKITESEALLQEIMQQEQESETAMTRRRDETASQLRGMHQQGQAASAYAQHAQNAGRNAQ